MTDALHRVLTGQSLTPGLPADRRRRGFLMDVVQFVDMVVGWTR